MEAKRKRKHTEKGGVSCGICETSLQQATLGFGIADVAHGIIGIAGVFSMILKKEVDAKYDYWKYGRVSGYTNFLREVPMWTLYFLVTGSMIQVAIGFLACLGATFRNSLLCTLWIIASLIFSPFTPITYSLLGLGRVYEWITVGEFVWKMDAEELEIGRDDVAKEQGSAKNNSTELIVKENMLTRN